MTIIRWFWWWFVCLFVCFQIRISQTEYAKNQRKQPLAGHFSIFFSNYYKAWQLTEGNLFNQNILNHDICQS